MRLPNPAGAFDNASDSANSANSSSATMANPTANPAELLTSALITSPIAKRQRQPGQASQTNMVQTNMVSEDDLLQIATLKKPYGIKGWLWVFSETENRSDIFSMQPWWMKTATGFKPLTVTDWRRQGTGVVAQFAQIADRNVAETMNGVSIWVTKDSLPENGADEYYWSDLVGLKVSNQAGEYLGDISELFETGAHAIMTVVATSNSIDDQQRLIPWHKQTIVAIDIEAGTLRVDWGKDF